MKIENRHGWNISIPEAIELQRELAGEVRRTGRVESPKLIAGADISAERGGMVTAAAVVLTYPGLELAELKTARGRVEFPYVPGLLSFREAPLTLAAFEGLSLIPDLVLVDGQGIAHPRRMGIASHLGLFLNKPTIGCAKSRLCGESREPALDAGNHTRLVHGGETIGAVLRTKTGEKPVYISIGHMVELDEAVGWALRCCRGYRVPEPTRLAHLAAGGNLTAN